MHGPPDLQSLAKRQSGRTSSVLSKAPGAEGEGADGEEGGVGGGGEAGAAEGEGEGGGGVEEGEGGVEGAAKAEELAMTAEVDSARIARESPPLLEI